MRPTNFFYRLGPCTHREPHPQSQNTHHNNKSKSISSTKRLFSSVLTLSLGIPLLCLSLTSKFFHLYHHQASHCSATTNKHFVVSLIRQILVGALVVTKMMCDSDPQKGSNNSKCCDWTQMMMVNMPANNISPSPSTSVCRSAAAAAATSSSSSAAAKAAMTQQEQHASGPLRCPRCDSANTKFCYYNNYSLTQPRHFCKACKRYWTRGGTLRNVPVGGGCRKNKRVKKQHHQPNTTTTTATATVMVNSDPLLPPPPPPPPLPTSSDLSSFFYGLTTSAMNMNLGSTAAAAYDALRLGGLIPTPASNQLMNTNLADLQQQPSSSSFLHHHNEQYPSSFGSQAASLLMSSLKQQPEKAEDQYGQSLLPYDSISANLGFLKDVKVEGDHSNLNNLMSNNIGTEWQAGGYPLFEANINGVTDASFLYWNPAMAGAAGWPDAANSSVAPLI